MKLPTYEELSKEQDRVYNLPLEESCLVTGPPGTGKTVMALYRARALDEADADPVLIMYFRLLNQYVENALEELKIDGLASTFHSWFGSWWWDAYHEFFPQLEPYKPDWSEIILKLQTNPPESNGAPRPHLVIDEAQDLDPHFFMMTSLVGRGVTVFADENQRITTTNSTLDEIRARARIDEELELTTNYRNTREIAQVARHFYTGAATGIADAPERSGPRPVLQRHDQLNSEVEWITRFANTNDDLTVGVFVPTKRLRKSFFNRLSKRFPLGAVQQYIGGQGSDAIPLDWDEPGIKIITYASAKGLEFDAVFIPQLQLVTWDLNVPDLSMTYYVLATRAREYLFFSFTGQDEPPILEIFPDQDGPLEYRL